MAPAALSDASDPLALLSEADECLVRGDAARARTLYERTRALLEQAHGPPREVARTLHGLAQALSDLGEYGAARPFVEQALSLRRAAFGDESVETAQSRFLLGGVLFDLGQFKAGQELIEQAYQERARLLGPDAPDTIDSQRSLALVLNFTGDHARAGQLLQEALSRSERALGERHRLTARVLNAQGLVWARDQSTQTRARAAYERALSIYEAVLGANHPDTARTMNNLAALLADMGDDDAARAMLRRSLAAHEQALGAAHPRFVRVLNNLGDLERQSGRVDEARRLHLRALVIAEQAYGAQHPETLAGLRKLVGDYSSLSRQGDPRAMDTAVPLHTILQSLEAAAGTLRPGQRQSPGAHLPPEQAAARLHELLARLQAGAARPPLSESQQADLDRAHALAADADQRSAEGDYAAAQARLTEALALQERALGPNHLDHVPLLENLARASAANRQPSAVLPLLQRVADIHVAVLGLDHPKTRLAQLQVAAQTMEEYDAAAALPSFEQAARSASESLGSEDPLAQMMRDSLERLKALSDLRRPAEAPPRESRSAKRERALSTLPPERAAVLAGVDAVDWHALHHAYGPADDVPDLLRLLLSDDADVQDDAWEKLYSNVWHQGTVYEATAHVVPFMLRLLAYDGPPAKSDILAFLREVAGGPDVDLSQAPAHVHAINHAVGEGIPQYLALLDGPTPELRSLALEVLASVRGRSGEIVPALLARLPALRDSALRAECARALLSLMDDGPAARQFFAEMVQRRESDALAFMGAVGLLERARGQAPDFAVSALLDGLRELGQVRALAKGATESEISAWRDVEARYGGQWGEWDGIHAAVHALVQLGSPRAVESLVRVVPLVRDGERTLEVAGAALDLVFHAGAVQPKSTARSFDRDTRHWKIDYWAPKPQPVRGASALTAPQRAVLEALLSHEPFWSTDHNLLRLYGLPFTRAALARFLG